MAYKYSLSLPKSASVKKHKLAIFLLITLLLFVGLACLILVWVIASETKSVEQPKTNVNSVSYQPLQTFQNQYFSFEADKSWAFMPNESSTNVFVYRSSKNNLVIRDLKVYVNTLPSNLMVTRILPVEADGDRLKIGEISEHCRQYLPRAPTDNNPINVNILSVTFRCQVDGTSNIAGSGQVNGSYQTELKSDSGGGRKYFLLYNDLEFTPNFNNFINIAKSFRAN